MNKTIAVLGLGIMGSAMARRLLEAGHTVIAFNRDPAKAAALADHGAIIATSPREAAAQAMLIISMVSDDPASRALWLGDQGDNGALAGVLPGAVCIESSTLSVTWAK